MRCSGKCDTASCRLPWSEVSFQTTQQSIQTRNFKRFSREKEHFIANLQRINEACQQNNIKFIVASQQAKAVETRD